MRSLRRAAPIAYHLFQLMQQQSVSFEEKDDQVDRTHTSHSFTQPSSAVDNSRSDFAQHFHLQATREKPLHGELGELCRLLKSPERPSVPYLMRGSHSDSDSDSDSSSESESEVDSTDDRAEKSTGARAASSRKKQPVEVPIGLSRKRGGINLFFAADSDSDIDSDSSDENILRRIRFVKSHPAPAHAATRPLKRGDTWDASGHNDENDDSDATSGGDPDDVDEYAEVEVNINVDDENSESSSNSDSFCTAFDEIFTSGIEDDVPQVWDGTVQDCDNVSVCAPIDESQYLQSVNMIGEPLVGDGIALVGNGIAGLDELERESEVDYIIWEKKVKLMYGRREGRPSVST